MDKREIKFRAWHLKEKLMYPVSELSFRAGGIKWYGPGVGWGWATADMSEVEVDSVLMENTGLKDKNDVEIYFGDVVRYRDDSLTWQTGVVEDYGYLRGFFRAIGGDDEGNQDVELHPDYAGESEVIGNIYEHGHLLESPTQE